MNKEQQELLDEAYEKALIKYGFNWLPGTPLGTVIETQEIFINKCKTDSVFSEKWGLKIEERELEYRERYSIWFSNNFETGLEYNENTEPNFNDPYYEPTPTRRISITYKGQTIESYE
jgi:hypothetical protein